MESCIKDLVYYRIEKAFSDLSVAKKLFDDELYSFALNRAYYSIFDAMRAINAMDSFDSSKHSGVISHFNQYYVKTGVFPPSSSSIIKRASMLREKSDYEDFYEPAMDETQIVLTQAEEFLKMVSEYIETKEGERY